MIKNWSLLLLKLARAHISISILAIVTLATGMSAVLLMQQYRTTIAAKNQWIKDKDRIAEIVYADRTTGKKGNSVPDPLAKRLYEDGHVQSYCYLSRKYETRTLISTTGEKVRTQKVFDTQGTFFSFFPFDIIYGTYEDFSTYPNAIALEKEIAVALFGDADAIDQIVHDVNGSSFQVKLVYTSNTNTSVVPEVVTRLLDAHIASELLWNNYGYGAVILLKNQQNFKQVEQAIDNYIEKEYYAQYAAALETTVSAFKKQYGDARYYLQALDTLYQKAEVTNLVSGLPNRDIVRLSVALSLFLFVFSVVNFMNLYSTLLLKRSGEFEVYRALGGTNGELWMRIFFEHAVVYIIAFYLSLVFSELCGTPVGALLKEPLSFAVDVHVLYVAGIAFLSALLSSILLFLYLLRKIKRLSDTVKKGSFWHYFVNHFNLLFQFTAAAVLLVVGYFAHHQIRYLKDKDLGFKGEKVLAVQLDEYSLADKYQKYRAFRQDILPLIGADAISASTVTVEQETPLSTTVFTGNELTDIKAMNVIYSAVEPSFFKTLDIRFTRGSSFQIRNDPEVTPTIITQGVAEQLKLGDALGSRLLFWGMEIQIVGVIDDINIYNLDTDPRPIIFLPIDDLRALQSEIKSVYIKLGAKEQEILAAVEEAWTRHMGSHFPFEYSLLDTSYEATYQTIRDQRILFIVAMLLILFLSLVGLYAFVAYSVEMREKEIAIKMALGISKKQLFFEIARPFIRIIVLGCMLSVFPAYYLIKYWVAKMHYQIDITLEGFTVSYLFLTCISLILIAYRVRRDSIKRDTVL